MGASNSPIQENNIEDFIKSIKQASSGNNNNIMINSIDMVVNGNQINYQNPNSYTNIPNQSTQMTSSTTNYQIEVNNVIKNINIKSEFGLMSLQVNSDDLINDIIQKYKSKLGQQNVEYISFYSQDNIFIKPSLQLKNTGLKDNSTIIAKIEYKKNIITKETNNNSNFNPNMNLSREDAIALKKKLKENARKGLITFIILNPSLKPETYFAKPNDRFQVYIDDYKLKNPGKQFYFLYKGLQISPEQTIKEQKIQNLSKILACDYDLD